MCVCGKKVKHPIKTCCVSYFRLVLFIFVSNLVHMFVTVVILLILLLLEHIFFLLCSNIFYCYYYFFFYCVTVDKTESMDGFMSINEITWHHFSCSLFIDTHNCRLCVGHLWHLSISVNTLDMSSWLIFRPCQQLFILLMAVTHYYYFLLDIDGNKWTSNTRMAVWWTDK